MPERGVEEAGKRLLTSIDTMLGWEAVREGYCAGIFETCRSWTQYEDYKENVMILKTVFDVGHAAYKEGYEGLVKETTKSSLKEMTLIFKAAKLAKVEGWIEAIFDAVLDVFGAKAKREIRQMPCYYYRAADSALGKVCEAARDVEKAREEYSEVSRETRALIKKILKELGNIGNSSARPAMRRLS